MKLLRLFVAVWLMAAPTMAYGQTGVPMTQIPQGRGAVMYYQAADGTYVPVSDANPLPGTGGSGGASGDIGESDDAACGSATGDCSLISLQKYQNNQINGEVPAGDEEVGKFTPTISNLISGTISSDMTSTTSTSLISAPGSGLTNYITHVGCSNTDADTDTVINLQDGNGGTVFYHGVAAKLGGGFSYSLSPPLKQPTANTALYVANVTTGATTRCSASGFKR